MTEQQKNALLPAGLRDVLPPDAAFEAEIVERLVASFAARGYDRIKPPLIEFEEGLLSGARAARVAGEIRWANALKTIAPARRAFGETTS